VPNAAQIVIHKRKGHPKLDQNVEEGMLLQVIRVIVELVAAKDVKQRAQREPCKWRHSVQTALPVINV
jgi:hypothetical protein